jgi:hypothetical protein
MNSDKFGGSERERFLAKNFGYMRGNGIGFKCLVFLTVLWRLRRIIVVQFFFDFLY